MGYNHGMTVDLTLVEDRRIQTAASLEAEVGQVFTPRPAADLLVSLMDLPQRNNLRVLDPGAGIGSLSASLVSRIAQERPDTSIEVVAVERDGRLLPALQDTLNELGAQGGVTTKAVQQDYLLEDHQELEEPFDLVVMNPPYAKLPAKSLERKELAQYGVDVPNLYAAFMALGLAQLRDGGQLTAIVPRSFMNGTYFTNFRAFLLKHAAIRRIHSFESRNTVFADSGVLQESVIINLERGGKEAPVYIGVSRTDEPVPHTYTVPYDHVVVPTDENRFIRIPSETGDAINADKTLGELGLKVATGKVVDFRARSYCLDEATSHSVPLIYPGNIDCGEITWPRSMPRPKPQYFDARDEFARKQVHPPGRYVVVKRFSAKEERRRVVAGIWESDAPVAFENKTNVIGPIPDRDVAIGLSIWLNSGPLDRLFRTFSGHTQVNAGDLRVLPIPDVDILQRLGTHGIFRLPEQSRIDKMVAVNVCD